MVQKKPFEIARETLMLLAARKLTPTPVNYQAVYSEIAGTPDAAPFPEAALRKIAHALPLKTPEQKKHREVLERAIGQHKWDEVQAALVAFAGAGAGNGRSGAQSAEAAAPSVGLLEMVARIIENVLPALGTDDERFADQAAQLLAALRDPSAELNAVRALLSSFTHRLSFVAEDQAEIRATLLKLLHVVIENIGELGLDERWLARDFDALVAGIVPPLTLRRLDDLERRLKNVLFKQVEAKARTLDAQAEMRQLLARFIERLGQMTDSTSAFHRKMEESARQMEQATNLEEIGPLMKSVISTTRDIVVEVGSVREDLRAMREKVAAAEAEIAQLHQELIGFSAQARHDTLTGALNRKGLEEALQRELSEVRRKEAPLCVAMLDVDNFKTFNETKGRDTGDAALGHLVSVTRECMRAQDTLARYGGEEFVILMPDTTLDMGVDAMTRLQRALTKRFFLAGAEKILITFSAGVAQFAPEESGDDAITRAGQAMYLAKRAGKNRVVAA
jgi:diguanylate cyclase